jgi:EmrB/QacA subfamily drug resistance transporter
MAYKWRATLIVAIGAFMAVLDNTIVNVALNYMRLDFHTTQSTIEWVLTGYFLSQAAVIPVVGYLADRVGEKLVFLIALGAFTLGSGLCAIAPSEGVLIAFRVFQGIGGGALLPIVFAVAFRLFPAEERGPASAVIGVPILIAPVIGPTLGGLLTTAFDWRAIFTVNLPIGVATFILAMLVLRSRQEDVREGIEPAEASSRLDVIGLALSIVGTTALVYGINESGSYGFADLRVWPYLAAGGVLLVAFVLYELQSSDPVMDVRLFRNYTFTMANVLTWSLSAFLFGSLFLLPFYFEQVQGFNALQTGETFILQGLGSVAGVVLGGRLYNRVGPRPLILVGLILIVIGSIPFTQLHIDTPSTTLQWWLGLRGIGFGMSNIPLQTVSVSVISNRAMARASSLINVTRQIFSAIGVAALTAYLTRQATGYAPSVRASFQAQAQQVAAQCAAKVGHAPQAIQQCVAQAGQAYGFQHAYTSGLNDTFVLVIIGTAATVLLAIFLGRDPAIERMKEAARRGETVETRPAMVAGE